MPPKTRITREMVLNAGFELVREKGIEALNVRDIAAMLKCSTQPVMYCFHTVEELKAELYKKADSFHSDYLLNVNGKSRNPMLSIGLNYIHFAYEEKHLFRFLFQSNYFAKANLLSLTRSNELENTIIQLQKSADLTKNQAKKAFSQLFLTAHGIASLLANNSMDYDEKYFTKALKNSFYGAIGLAKGGIK